MNLRLQLAGLCIVASILGLSPVSGSSQACPANIVIATGREQGTYNQLGNALKARMAARGLQVETRTSQGSKENVDLLNDCQVQFAFVQSDVAHQAVRGHRPFASPSAELRVVTPLLTESVHILVRSHLFVFTAGELKGKIVSLGAHGSGTYSTARAVLEAAGVSTKELEEKTLNSDEISEQLQAESIDAAFLTAPVGSRFVEQVLANQEARLLPLESRVIDRLVREGTYIETYIPKKSYPNQDREVPTIGMQALLVTRSDTDRAIVQLVDTILREDRRLIEKEIGNIKLDELNSVDVQVSALPFYPIPRRLTQASSYWWVFLLVVFLLAAAVVGLLFRNREQLRRAVAGAPKAQESVLEILLVSVGIWMAGSWGLYHFEHHVNENFDSFPKAVWSMLVYVAGGFQTRVPMTRGGEAVAVLATAFGLALVAWLTATLASHFVKHELGLLQRLLKGKKLMPSHLRDHIVIVNWDEGTRNMVRELHGPDFANKRHIVVISEVRVELPDDLEFKLAYVVEGDPRHEEALRKAHIFRARSVTIRSAWPVTDQEERRKALDPDVKDTKTISTIRAIRAICRQEMQADGPPITAEIRSKGNSLYALDAGGKGETHIVCVDEFGAGILTQCALTPNLAELYRHLLTFTKETNEIYEMRVPEPCLGKSFGWLMHYFAEHRSEMREPIIPVGICRDSKLYVNPTEEQVRELYPQDFLFVIAYHEFDQKSARTRGAWGLLPSPS